jgi:hypothetical protein
MTSDQKKPGMAFWASVVVVVVFLALAYPLSYGPWLVIRKATTTDVWRYPERLYRPLAPLVLDGPDWLIEPYLDYLERWDTSVIENVRRYRAADLP